MHPAALCMQGLFSAVVLLTGCGMGGMPYQLEYLRAAMTFMATLRSETERAQLYQHLSSCRCYAHHPGVYALHSPPPPAVKIKDLFELVLFHVCKALAISIEVFRPAAHDAAKRWPVGMKDLDPFNAQPRALCDALMQWAAHSTGGSAVFILIGAVAKIWKPFEDQVLATPRVFALATEHLEDALANYPTHDVGDLWQSRFGARVFACAGSLCQGLAGGRPQTADIILRRPGILARMHTIAKCMQAHLNPRAKGDEADCCAWFTVVCARVNGRFVARGVPPPPISTARNGYLHNAWGVIITMRSSKCTRVVICPRDTESRVCGKCGVARYCSPEHQREAWDYAPQPHRAFCKAIQRLREAIHMEDPVAWTRLIHDTESGRSPHAFNAVCDRYNVSPDLCKAILSAAGWAV
ncbi:hypothetical protein DFH06DRAFT_1139914 [Mycena polygramma]|nr:hypothetical protein DFH06DRAFT_1139914 [Mycena polygramma]